MTVTLEHLFPHLDDLIQTPADVQRLNEAILQLAVQGKLVPQDPGDEPAGALLKRIAVERGKEVSAISAIPEGKQTYKLPGSWEWVRFGSICEHRLGKMLDNQKNKGEYRPYLRNLNVQWDRIDFDDIQVMRFEPQEFDEYRLLPGDLLICEGGEPGRCSIWDQAETEMMFQKAIHRARPYCGIMSRYLLFHLRADADGGQLANYFTGATIQHFTGRALTNYCIALPPLAEQKRIVAKVDELFAQTRSLETKLRRAQEAIVVVNRAVLHHLHQAADNATFQHAAQILGDHFDLLYTDPRPVTDLRQTILQLAVQGKLVPQDPHDEPAGELLNRVAMEKERLVAEGKVGKEKPLPPIDEDEMPFALPMGWEWVRLGWLVKSMTNGLYKPSGFYTDRGIISLRMFNIQDGVINLDGAKRLEVTPEELNNYALEKGDLLINRVNSKELVGKAALIKATGENMVFESMNIRVRLMEKANLPEYLNLLLRSSYIQEAFRGLAKQAIGQASVNQLQIASLAIPLPPLAEQKRIVAKVDELLARCAALERKLGQAQGAGRQITAAVLQGVVG